MDEKQTLLTFPCDFPIKVMGFADSGFEAHALVIVREFAPDFQAESMHTNASREGKYIAVTFTLTATSQEQLDAIYCKLTACDDILMAL